MLLAQIAVSQVAVTTYRNDNARTGQNVNEGVLTPSNVNVNSFGRLFSYSLPADSYVYAQPLFLPNVNIPNVGLRNVFFIATEHDVVYAFDADGPGTTYWTADLAGRVGGSPITTSGTTHDDYLGPQLGVTSTPVIDQSTGTMYVVANTSENGNRVQRLHALEVTTGAEKFGGPVVIQGSASGATFDPSIQNQRPALLLANGNVYIAWGAYGDNGPYHGWVMAYNASTLGQIAVFCTTPNGKAGSNWMLGALTSDQDGNVYTVTGNGTVDTNGDHGESVIKLSPTLVPVNGFTPSNWSSLNANDLDLGGGGLLQLPDQPGTAPHLAVLAGKEGTIYLLNRDDLGQFNTAADHVVQEIAGPDPSTCNVDQECNFQTPAYWNNNVYFATVNHPLQIYQLTNGTLNGPVSQGGTTLGTERGASPMVSANGNSNGIVWALRVDDSSSAAPDAILYAYDATNAANKLYSSDQNSGRDSPGQAQFFIVPVVANGKVYVATRSQASVYGLLAYTNAKAPTIQLGLNPTSGGAPLTVTASTSGSTDPNSGGSIVSSWIDFGDSTVVNATTANHTYNSPGSYTVHATVYGSSGKSSRTSTTVTVASAPPTIVSVTPSSGIGMSQTFTLRVSDSGGWAYISSAELLVNSTLSYYAACAISWDGPTMKLYLRVDDGSSSLPGMTPGTAGTLQNSQCSLNVGSSSVSGSGNNLTVTVAVTFKSSFAGQKNLYSIATDNNYAVYSSWKQLGTWAVAASSATAISHVLFMLQENHSFDNYFGRMGQYRANKGFTDSFDGVPLNVSLTDANGKAVSPYHLATVCTEDLAPGWDPIHLDIDGGRMDKFPVETQNFLASSIDSGGRRSMGYYDWNDLPYYYELGFQYATSDRYFSSVQARTEPNRMYMFAGTSFGHINNDTAPGGGWSKTTIFDRLDAAGVSWRIYTVDNTNSLAEWATYSRDSNKVFPISQYFTDIKSDSTTPQVVFIDRGGGSSGLDEHPGSDIQNGAHEVAGIVNALLASPTYKSSAFFLSWDEPGGFYDHVAPVAMTAPDSIQPAVGSGDQPGDFAHSGLRVPVVVISPWVKPHFVSHVARDHTSILKFIETRFNLAPLTARDSNADNMMEFFDFSTPQIATPPALPAQPTNATCDQSQETANSGLPHAVLLNWVASPSMVAGYNVYRGTQTGGPYTLVSTTLVPGTSFQDTNVQAGNTYFYTVTAVGSNSVESDPSNESESVIPSG